MDEIMKTTNQTPIEIVLQIDDEGYTTSKKLYEWLQLDASHYSRWVKTNISENVFAEEGVDYSPCKASKARGNFADNYKLTADFAKKLSMMQKSERGEQARQYFLGCEQVLKIALEANRRTEIERAKGIAVRQALTKAIQQSNENDRMHGHAYSTYTNVIYKSVFGKDAKQLREDYGIGKQDNLRDCFTEEELKRIQNAEMTVSGLIGYGWGYGEIKEFITKQAQKMIE